MDYDSLQGTAPFYAYAIACKTPRHFYVGRTSNLSRRINQHANGQGSEFTKKHGYSRVVEVKLAKDEREASYLERRLFEIWVSKHGIKRVAGSYWSQSERKDRRKAWKSGRKLSLTEKLLRREKKKVTLKGLLFGKSKRKRSGKR